MLTEKRNNQLPGLIRKTLICRRADSYLTDLMIESLRPRKFQLSTLGKSYRADLQKCIYFFNNV